MFFCNTQHHYHEFYGLRGGHDEYSVIRNIEKATKIILIAGHIERYSKDFEEEEKLALDRMDEWRTKIGNIALLHMILVSILKNKHFFLEGLMVAEDVAIRLKKMADTVEIIQEIEKKNQQKQSIDSTEKNKSN
mgnify:FL=1